MTRETRTAVSVSDSRAGNGVTRETSEDLNKVKILERASGEEYRPASRETRTAVSVSDNRAGRARRDCQERLGRERGEDRPASEATRDSEDLNKVKILEKSGESEVNHD
ncbi:hypothetical protein [Halapricum hydrolyticum]|uniref:Uncharacterized protein n=1 Tax=Halapricum hydrolyticum TaxID=2979991 RepID=A0AAE3LEC3_9EURY|nr:hypothetical protein [Halapricum hydrolyticum]MCU4726182.1 hypothetical protein [Halapricum hydrolyticum]